jgi:alanyl-tRNA synthetase
MKTSAEIRQTFLDFFKSKGHTIVPSAPLVPGNDPTLLFTNSGMVQFKNVFLGSEKLAYVRAADVQRCLRAGGKHNDLDSVGYTARHHTFFEMLGNWSFGDYFKREAILWAWELLTGVFQLPKDRLLVTVYQTDDEAYDLWHKDIGLPPERIVRIGDNRGAPFASDNFWQMADTGPCGPCTEIFYDHGAQIPGGPPGSPDEDGDRFIEIWNLVFMQFDRAADGTLTTLPAPCVDTGMGLERLAAVLQHVHSNYEIDLFQHLIKVAAQLTNTQDLENKSLRVIADHIRACSFLIVDGVLPSNEGRGYVLRRIIRRALRHGYMLGQREPFFYKLVPALVEEMGQAYPELVNSSGYVEKALFAEEERFGDTLTRGMNLVNLALDPNVPVMRYLANERKWEKYGLNYASSNGLSLDGLVSDLPDGSVGVLLPSSLKNALRDLQEAVLKIHTVNERGWEHIAELIFVLPVTDQATAEAQAVVQFAAAHSPLKITPFFWTQEMLDPYLVLSGEVIFKLYDTYGFPVDLTADICRERGYRPDLKGFELELEKQRERARAASQFEGRASISAELVQRLPPTDFIGYGAHDADALNVLAILRGGRDVSELDDGQEATLILDATPFYAESGGQVGDTGLLSNADGEFTVTDTVKLAGAYHGHVGRWKGKRLRVGAPLNGSIDAARRQSIVLNHSATHLLHAALRQVLGEHVTQKGSLVAPDRLRFDFSHFKPVAEEELLTIEDLVNAEVRRNVEAEVHQMGYQEAIDFGAMALFGEKYGDRVRVLKMGEFSTELCGGTHVARSGDIGLFKIVGESGVAAGIRRIEALTGAGALAYVAAEESRLETIANLLSASGADVVDKLQQLFERQKKLERELEGLKAKAASAATLDLAAHAKDVQGIKVVAARLDGADAKALRDSVDQFKQKLGDCVVLLAGGMDGKVALVAGVHGNALGRIKAGELVAHVAQQIGGKGGGRADMAQGGGEDSPRLSAALDAVPAWVAARLT